MAYQINTARPTQMNNSGMEAVESGTLKETHIYIIILFAPIDTEDITVNLTSDDFPNDFSLNECIVFLRWTPVLAKSSSANYNLLLN